VDGRAGESFDPAPASPGDADIPLGRFKLTTDDNRSTLESVTVSNEGTPISGVNSLELWSSSDNTFDPASDTELSSLSYSSPANFTGLGAPLSTSGTYFFVVADLGSSPSGTYDPAIASESTISLEDGRLTSINGFQQSSFDVSSGEGFLSTGPTAPLPVELAGFSAQLTNGGTVVLQWQTLSETNNSRFNLQRRETNQQTWSTIAMVEGAGTTNDPQRYRFTDRDLPYTASSLTYRLKQIDVDGTDETLSTVEVQLDAPQRVELMSTSPNPARNRVTARLAVPETVATESIRFRLYDILGRQVRSFDDKVRTGQRLEVSLDLSGLASGTYLLRLIADGNGQTQRITVVR